MISKKTKKVLALTMTLTVSGDANPAMNTKSVAFAEEKFIEEEDKIDSDNINNLQANGLENNDTKNSFKSKSIKTTGESVSLGNYGEIQNKIVKTTDAGVALMMLDSWTSINDFSNVGDNITINNIEFTLNSDNTTVTVSNHSLREETDLDLPETITCGNKDYTVTGINSLTFYYCKYLTSVKLSKEIKNIGAQVFSQCSKLTSIEVANDSANYTSDNGVLFSKDKKTIMCYPSGKEGEEYVIPEVVTRLEDLAFSGCIKLTSISFPQELNNMGSEVFYGCSGITNINIPEGVTSIEAMSFWGCYALTSVRLPESLESISGYAFLGCRLKSVNLPKKVTRIDEFAFYNSGLTAISIPKGVKSIGYMAFAACNDLEIAIVSKDLDDASINNIKTDVPCIIKYEEDASNMKISDILFNDSNSGTKLIIPSKIYDKQVTSIGDDALNVIKDNADKTIVENKDMLKLLEDSNAGIDIDKITVKSNKQELQNLYYTCISAGYSENDYIADTYAAYNTAMDETENVLNNKKSDQADVDSAFKNLEDAVNGLQEKPVANKYTVTFNSNGGSEVVPIENVEEGTVIILLTAPTKAGYTFKGWYTDAACSEGNEFTSSTLVNDDMTVYAKWTKRSSSSSSSSKKERPLLKNEDGKISNIVLNKYRYSNEIVGTSLSHIGLAVNNVGSLYKIDTDVFKGNLATFAQIVVGADGKETSLSYIYVKCEKAGISTLKVDVYSLKDKDNLYVYNTDELGNVKLVKVVSQYKIKDNDNFIDIKVEDGQNYMISEVRLQEKTVASESTLAGGWKQIEGKWTYIKEGKTAIGWIKDTDGKWYNIDSAGFMKTGWHKDSDGKWYNLSQNGAMRTGWFKDNNEKWYLLNNSGAMVTGWIQNGDKWYYLNDDGSMAVDTTVNGYYVNKSGEWE